MYQQGVVNFMHVIYKQLYRTGPRHVNLQASKECITVKQRSIIIYRDLETACLVRASWDCSPADECIYTEVLSEPEATTVSF